MKNIISSLLILFISSICIAQQTSNWQVYTDMKNVSTIKANPDGIWAASGGGAFFYSFTNSEINTFTKAEGLNGTDLNALTIDNNGKVWFGADNGLIDILDPSDNSVSSLLDIFNSEKTNKSINDLIVSGDTILVATDFGISLIDPNSNIFYDTYFKFGDFSSNIKVNSVFKKDRIYAATELGVAIQKPNATNLSAPESWFVYDNNNGLPSIQVNEVIIYDDKVLAATPEGLSVLQDTIWTSFNPQLDGKNIIDLVVNGNQLYILSGNDILLFENGTLSTVSEPSLDINSVTVNNNKVYAATTGGIFDVQSGVFHFPNSPAANQFPDIAVDGSGNIWSASGKDNGGKGFYFYDGNKWNNFNINSHPVVEDDDYYRVFADGNEVYLGSWGYGFIRYADGTLTKFDAANTGMLGIPVNTLFLVITGFTKDSRNNLWVLNFWSANRRTLSMLTPDSLWYHFNVPSQNNLVLEKHFNLVNDQFDTKWFNSEDPARSGLYYFNEQHTYSDSTDDISGYITVNDGLNSNTITDIQVDRRGDVWVGTSLGINVISNTAALVSNTGTNLRLSSVFSVRQQRINAIAVDALNQKWIATNQGLLLLNSDGSRLLSTLDSKNSPLLSDQVISLAIDQNSGRVFAGTPEGLISFDTPSIKPADSFDGLSAYPSPYVIKDGSQLLTIDGLIRDTEIKILTITGKLIAEFFSPGGRVAFWDGKDLNGDLVNSGIYIVVAYDQDGSNVETGKIAVIRE